MANAPAFAGAPVADEPFKLSLSANGLAVLVGSPLPVRPTAPISPVHSFQGTVTEMTTFDDREKAFEAKFARDEEMAFRITARRNRLVGQWAAAKMNLTPEETDAYAKAVVQADFEEAGDADVVRKIVGDLTAAGVDTDEAEVEKAISDLTVEARRQIIEAI